MGMKTRGGMYCINETKPVAAVKTTTRMRNTFALGASIATMGGSLLAGKVNGWHCPDCGGPVTTMASAQRQQARTSTSAVSPGAVSPGVLDEIERLDGLRQRGALTDAEFASYKARLLGGGSTSPAVAPAPARRELPPPPPARAELPPAPPPSAPVGPIINGKGLPIPYVPERKPSTGFWAQVGRSFVEGWRSSKRQDHT
jgi:hypothetical protein